MAAVLRLVALGCAYWLLATTLAYVAALVGRVPRLLRALAWTTPAPVRRLVDGAMALSVAATLAGGSAALAATPPPPPTPVVAVVAGQPGVLIPPGAVPGARPSPAPPRVPQPSPQPIAQGSAQHLVVPGNNLWSISAARIAAGSAREAPRPTNAHIASYWVAVVKHNRSTLRSGNPDLIFPGETILLPPTT